MGYPRDILSKGLSQVVPEGPAGSMVRDCPRESWTSQDNLGHAGGMLTQDIPRSPGHFRTTWTWDLLVVWIIHYLQMLPLIMQVELFMTSCIFVQCLKMS